MRYLRTTPCILLATLLILASTRLCAQSMIPVDSNSRLTYKFVKPAKTGLALAKAGLPTLDGEFVSVKYQRGNTIAEIIAKVRPSTWASNPEVWGSDPGGEAKAYFGKLQSYLGGDPRFRILTKPAYCEGCDGVYEVTFLRFDDTGYLVGGGRTPPQ